MIGHNFAYKQVIVNGKHNLGDELQVMINETTTYDLRAKN